VQQEQMAQQGGDATVPRGGGDVTGMENTRNKGDDVTSVSSVGQTVSRDRDVAERMYVYY